MNFSFQKAKKITAVAASVLLGASPIVARAQGVQAAPKITPEIKAKIDRIVEDIIHTCDVSPSKARASLASVGAPLKVELEGIDPKNAVITWTQPDRKDVSKDTISELTFSQLAARIKVGTELSQTPGKLCAIGKAGSTVASLGLVMVTQKVAENLEKMDKDKKPGGEKSEHSAPVPFEPNKTALLMILPPRAGFGST